VKIPAGIPTDRRNIFKKTALCLNPKEQAVSRGMNSRVVVFCFEIKGKNWYCAAFWKVSDDRTIYRKRLKRHKFTQV
jgi:hypothetical protein